MEPNVCFAGHAIVCGCGHLGKRVAEGLCERGCEVVVVEKSPDDSMRKYLEIACCRLVEGDVRNDDVLEQAGVRTAGCIVVVTGDDAANLEASIDARRLNATANVVARIFDQDLARRGESAFGIRALSASYLASPAFVSAATDESLVAMLTIDGQHLSILRPTNVTLGQGTPICRDRTSLGVIERADGVACEDRLVACVHNAGQRRRSGQAASKAGCSRRGRLSMPNPLTSASRLAGVWRHASPISKNLLVAFLAVALFSVFVFAHIGRMRVLDATYFVVTTMTTTGYGDINLQHAAPGMKVYGILMMLAGAALLATIYAIIADYVLTARIEHLLGRRRVSMSGHTVVVGLGNVGFRVAHDLKLLGINVVAVEAREELDNVAAARPLFPVVIGDASKGSVLERAGLNRASTILALTDDPMVNLSVALNAREQNPSVRVILRTYDTHLADKFRAIGLDEVLSTSAIAAPAFVDAAVYPGVQGSFRFGDLDVLVARHAVTADSPLAGKSVGDIGSEMGVAVALVAPGPTGPYRCASVDEPLREGQVVIALLARERMGLLANGSATAS